jgi:hypothetical protein
MLFMQDGNTSQQSGGNNQSSQQNNQQGSQNNQTQPAQPITTDRGANANNTSERKALTEKFREDKKK